MRSSREWDVELYKHFRAYVSRFQNYVIIAPHESRRVSAGLAPVGATTGRLPYDTKKRALRHGLVPAGAAAHFMIRSLPMIVASIGASPTESWDLPLNGSLSFGHPDRGKPDGNWD